VRLHVVLEVGEDPAWLGQHLLRVRVDLAFELGAIRLHISAFLGAQVVRKLRSVRVAVAALRVGKGILRHLLVQKALLLNSVLVCLNLLFFLLNFQLNSLLFDLVLQVLI